MLIKDLVVVAALVIVGGAVGSIVWRIVTPDKKLRALQEAVDQLSAGKDRS